MQKTIERRDDLKQTDAGNKVIQEIEYVLGNFIGQALIREIEINDILNLSDKNIITENVSESALEYLHYYENEKYFMLKMSKKPYKPTQYNQVALDFIYQNGGNPNELIKIETENSKNTPSGEYTMYFSYVGMSLLSGATTIWSGLIPWNDLSSDKPIGFDFYFYRGDDPEANDSVRVSTNGYLTMFQKGAGALDGTDPSNDQITSTTDPDGYLAPWWDDLIIRMQGDLDKVSYKTEGSVGSRVFTVEYYSVTRNGGDLDDYHYFQVQLHEGSNIISFRYGSWNPDSEDNATVAMEDYSGLDGDCGFNCSNTNSSTPAVNVNFRTSTPGYWTGETDTDWLTASNWDDNNVPDGSTDVFIPSGCPNYPVINGHLDINFSEVNTYECNSLKINSGASASTIGVFSSVHSIGELIVEGQFDIGDDLNLYDGSATTLSGTIRTGVNAGFHGEAYHHNGSIFNQTGGDYYVESIILDTTGYYFGTSGAVHIYDEVYSQNPQEINIHNSDSHFFNLYIEAGAAGSLSGSCGLDVDVVTQVYGLLDVYGTIHTQFMNVFTGGELIIHYLCFVNVTGNGPYFYNGSSLQMYHHYFFGWSSTLTSQGNITFYSGSSTYCTSGAWIHVAENLTDTDNSLYGNVKFFGNSNSNIYGYPTFRSLSIEKTGSTVNYASDDVISISEHMFINSGTFNPNDYTIEIGGSWINDVGDGGFDEGLRTVLFTGNNISSIGSNETFYNIIVNDTLKILSDNTVTAINNLDINGVLTLKDNTILLLGNSLNVNDGGYFRVVGFSGSEALVSHYSGYYDFNVFSGGKIYARYGIFEYMSTNGVHIHDGATIVSPAFYNCTFSHGIFSGTLLTINNNQDMTIEAAFFPTNTWGGLFNVAKTLDQGSISFENYSGDYAGESYENDPNNRISWILTSGFYLDVTIFLEGPFNSPDMSVDLNTAGLLPLSQTYSGPPWDYPGTESVSSIPNGDVVEWVLIEIRDAVDAVTATPPTVFARHAAFILKNGKVVGLDGSSMLHFDGTINNNLFVVIYHRNHLGVMSAIPLTGIGIIYSYDFSTGEGQAYNGSLGHKYIGGGKYGMIAADANANGLVDISDKTIWTNQAGEKGYNSADFDMDGQVNNPDKNGMWIPNEGEGSQVPQ